MVVVNNIDCFWCIGWWVECWSGSDIRFVAGIRVGNDQRYRSCSWYAPREAAAFHCGEGATNCIHFGDARAARDQRFVCGSPIRERGMIAYLRPGHLLPS